MFSMKCLQNSICDNDPFTSKKNYFPQKSIRIALLTMFFTSWRSVEFPVYGEKIKLGNFRPFLRLAVLKVQNFCQNKSSRAEKLATSLFLYGESEIRKIGPEMIGRPPRFQVMRLTLTTTLNHYLLIYKKLKNSYLLWFR